MHSLCLCDLKSFALFSIVVKNSSVKRKSLFNWCTFVSFYESLINTYGTSQQSKGSVRHMIKSRQAAAQQPSGKAGKRWLICFGVFETVPASVQSILSALGNYKLTGDTQWNLWVLKLGNAVIYGHCFHWITDAAQNLSYFSVRAVVRTMIGLSSLFEQFHQSCFKIAAYFVTPHN